MSGITLKPSLARALSLLHEADQPGVTTSDATPPYLIDGQPFINWQTAEALERRGLVRLECLDDGVDIHLTQAKEPA